MTSALGWLRPPDLEPLTTVGLAAMAGMAGARYDGLLLPTYAEHAGAADVLAAAEGRATALRGELPTGGALARFAAVWVHTGRLRPRRVAVVVATLHRVQCAGVVHRQRIAPDDVAPVGGVATTTPARTAVDLLCFEPEQAAVAGTRALLTAGLDPGTVRAALERAPRPAVRRGAALLARAVPGEERR